MTLDVWWLWLCISRANFLLGVHCICVEWHGWLINHSGRNGLFWIYELLVCADMPIVYVINWYDGMYVRWILYDLLGQNGSLMCVLYGHDLKWCIDNVCSYVSRVVVSVYMFVWCYYEVVLLVMTDMPLIKGILWCGFLVYSCLCGLVCRDNWMCHVSWDICMLNVLAIKLPW